MQNLVHAWLMKTDIFFSSNFFMKSIKDYLETIIRPHTSKVNL